MENKPISVEEILFKRELNWLDENAEMENETSYISWPQCIQAMQEYASILLAERWATDDDMKNFAEQYRFSSSRISLKQFKETKGYNQTSVQSNYEASLDEKLSELQSLLADKDKEISGLKEDVNLLKLKNISDSSDCFVISKYVVRRFLAYRKKLTAERDHYKALAEAAHDLIDIDPLYVSGYTKERWNKYQNLKNQIPGQ